MWQFIETESTSSQTTLRIQENNSQISHKRFLNLLSESDEFRNRYNSRLAECKFEAFFWENKSMTHQHLDETYEFKLINSDYLTGVSPDSRTFRQYFDPGCEVVDFPNIGGDAHLIVPCPGNSTAPYTHIGNFVRDAQEHQIQQLWKRVGSKTLSIINTKPRWLSTSGLGVYWLHVRIDSVPKYYQTEGYKQM
ncbi:hypothetical protein BH23BAC3_BH23BAC3_28340 [soil metagenome]